MSKKQAVDGAPATTARPSARYDPAVMLRRVLRHLFTLCAAASLLLGVATSVLSVRSYWIGDSIDRTMEKRVSTAGVALGVAYVYDERVVDPNASYRETEDEPYGVRYDATEDPIGWPTASRSGGRNVDHRIGNLRLTFHDGTGTAWQTLVWCVTVPCWLIASTFTLLPATWCLLRLRVARRIRRGRCATCGYDLRATPDRCPECGTVRRSSPQAAAL
jgi:hypothetical protein